MTHKILITFAIENPPRFRALVGPTDAVRGELATISFTLANLGDTVFPGGTVSSMRINYGTSVFTTHKVNWRCPQLPPQNITVPPSNLPPVVQVPVVPPVEGLAWIHLTLAADDYQPIEYYQQLNEPLQQQETAEWFSCFYVVNREILLLTAKFTR